MFHTECFKVYENFISGYFFDIRSIFQVFLNVILFIFQLIVNPREEEKSDLALNNPLSQEVEVSTKYEILHANLMIVFLVI